MTDYPIGYETIGYVAMLTNPKSADADRSVADRAMERFSQVGVEVATFQGIDEADTRRLIRQAIADDFDAVVVCGGDGSINLALQELAGTDIPIGIIPAGRGNDHAKQFRIPTSPESAADVIYEGFTTTSDLAKVNTPNGEQLYYGTVACVGFDSNLGKSINGLTLPGKRLGYTASVAAEFWAMRPRLYRIEFEGLVETPYLDDHALSTRIARDGQNAKPNSDRLILERRLSMAAFGNTRYYAGGMMVCPRADHHDDCIDITIVEEASRLGVMRSYLAFRKGNHFDFEHCSSYRCKKATISLAEDETAEGVLDELHVDGDVMTKLPVTIESVSAAARFIVPAP